MPDGDGSRAILANCDSDFTPLRDMNHECQFSSTMSYLELISWITTSFSLKELEHQVSRITVDQINAYGEKESIIVEDDEDWANAIDPQFSKTASLIRVQFCVEPATQDIGRRHCTPLDDALQQRDSTSKVTLPGSFPLLSQAAGDPQKVFQRRTKEEQTQMLQYVVYLAERNPGITNQSNSGDKRGETDLTYQMCMKFLDNKKLQRLRDRTAAVEAITHRLNLYGTSNIKQTIVYRLPPQRHRPNGEVVFGNEHKAHQQTFLAWALWMEESIQCGICADYMGLGKTHEWLSLIVAGTNFWEQRGTGGATLVVVPNNQGKEAYDIAQNQLGEGFNVMRYGIGGGVSHSRCVKKIMLTPKDEHFADPIKRRRLVVIITYPTLQGLNMKDFHRGLFFRIILDEAHQIRKGGSNQKRANNVRLFDAYIHWCFTGTLLPNKIKDLRGYLYLLERQSWYEPTDQNLAPNSTLHLYQQYLAKRTQQLNDKTLASKELGGTPPSWCSECSSAPVEEAAHESKKRSAWLCKHWPALLHENNNKPSSVESRDRLPKLNPSTVSLDGAMVHEHNFSYVVDVTGHPRGDSSSAPLRRKRNHDTIDSSTTSRHIPPDPPFANNPYNLYHKNNLNRMRCCTLLAFSYYVEPHIDRTTTPGNPYLIETRISIILEILAICRTPSSTVIDFNGEEIPCAADVPAMALSTQELSFAEDEYKLYLKLQNLCGREILPKNPLMPLSEHMLKQNLVKIIGGKKFREVYLLTTSLLLYGIRKSKAKTVGKDSILQLLERSRQGLTEANCCPDILAHAPSTLREAIEQMFYGSPKFRFYMRDLLKMLYGDETAGAPREGHRNVLTLFQWPVAALMYSKILAYFGISNSILLASQDADERTELIRAFDEDGTVSNLILTFSLDVTGFTVVKRCCTVHAIEAASNDALEKQGFARVHRFGQTERPTVTRSFVRDTYLELHERHMIEKLARILEGLGVMEQARKNGFHRLTSLQLAARYLGVDRIRARDPKDVGVYKWPEWQECMYKQPDEREESTDGSD